METQLVQEALPKITAGDPGRIQLTHHLDGLVQRGDIEIDSIQGARRNGRRSTSA